MGRALRAVLAVLALGVAACDDGNDAESQPTSAPATATSPTTQPETTPPSTAAGDLAAAAVTLTPVADIEAPTAMAVREGDTALYVTERAGRVVAVRDGALDPQPVLDLTGQVATGGERGLLGLAFSPDGTHLYVHYSDSDGDTRVEEYAMADGTANPSTARELLALDQPQSNHNGGQLVVDADGLLYIGLGDGGAAADQGPGHAPEGNGQSLDTLLGKILRIDPRATEGAAYTVPADNPFAAGGGLPEIYAYGLRNPWRFSFDRETGDLWIGDVGQNAWEEIDYLPAGSAAGANLGWPQREGTHEFRGERPPGAVDPIFEYPNPAEGCAVTGGYVYRGEAIPDLTGAYVFADYCEGDLRALVQEGGAVVAERFLDVGAANIAAFGQDRSGELYVLSQGDGLLRLDPA
ncbi:MAG TPA: PQQ-dependent sugar dehydrogenase [Acidimicrobiia bacterium]